MDAMWTLVVAREFSAVKEGPRVHPIIPRRAKRMPEDRKGGAYRDLKTIKRTELKAERGNP